MKYAKRILVVLVALSLAFVVFHGCEKAEEKKKPQVVEKKEKAAEELKKKEAVKKKEEVKAPIEAAPGKDPDCWGKDDPKAPRVEFEAAGEKYEIVGNYRLKAINGNGTKPLVLGVLTDIKNNIPRNIENLKKFFETFKKEKATAVVIAGDTSEKYESLKPLFEFLAKQNLLTLVIMGNREVKEDYVKAAAEVHAQYKNFIDMNRIRTADLKAATVVSLAGYYDPNYIHNPPGCAYTPQQIVETKNLIDKIGNAAVLLSHGPPRGTGQTAIDQAVEAGNVGDPMLTKLISDAGVPFGVFGNIHEAGGKAVGGDFKGVLAQNKPLPRLYLNPGPADSDPWKMNDGSISRGMAAILTIKGNTASYKIIRAEK